MGAAKMKITKQRLKEIIKEELDKFLAKDSLVENREIIIQNFMQRHPDADLKKVSRLYDNGYDSVPALEKALGLFREREGY